MIQIQNLRRPGEMLDSSKLSILGGKISRDIEERTRGQYIVVSKIKGLTMSLVVKVLNPETKKYSPAIKNEQNILAAKISNFLNSNNISHDIKVI